MVDEKAAPAVQLKDYRAKRNANLQSPLETRCILALMNRPLEMS